MKLRTVLISNDQSARQGRAHIYVDSGQGDQLASHWPDVRCAGLLLADGRPPLAPGAVIPDDDGDHPAAAQSPGSWCRASEKFLCLCWQPGTRQTSHDRPRGHHLHTTNTGAHTGLSLVTRPPPGPLIGQEQGWHCP